MMQKMKVNYQKLLAQIEVINIYQKLLEINYQADIINLNMNYPDRKGQLNSKG